MCHNLQLPGINIGDHAGSLRGSGRQIVYEKIAGDLPWPTCAVSRDVPGESRIVEILYNRSQSDVGVVHLHRPESWIPAQDKRLASCPNQAAPEDVIHALNKAKSVSLEISIAAEINCAPGTMALGKNERVGTKLRYDRP